MARPRKQWQGPRTETPFITRSEGRGMAPVSTAEGRPVTEPSTLHDSHFQANFATVPAQTSTRMVIQPQLQLGAANDPYEQEADRVANQVVHHLSPPAAPVSGVLPGGQAGRRAASTPARQGITPVQRARTGSGTLSAGLEGSIHQARRGGQALAPTVQTQMGQAMGADFRGVRVHTDGRADALNRTLGARAFTTGQDVFFKQGEYQPGSRSGQALIAHELTHVMQQRSAFHTSVAASPAAAGVVQLARGKAGRIASDIGFGVAGLLLFGVGAIAGVVGAEYAARSVFGSEQDRTRINTSTANLDPANTKPYAASDITIGNRGTGYILRGRRYDPKPAFQGGPAAGKAVILFSGSGGPNEDMMEPVAAFYCRQGATAYGVNYRGYGGSRDVNRSGRESNPLLSEQGLYGDAMRIYDYVRQTYAAGDITLHGFSLGGAVAAHLAKTLAKPVAQGGPGVQLGGLVLHSSIKTAYEAASEIAGPIGGLGAKGSAGSFSTVSKLNKLAARDPNLPIHFMGGSYDDGDQLALSHTQLEQTQAGTLANVSSRSGTGGHLVPGGHLAHPAMRNELVTLVGKGRARDVNDLEELTAV